MTMLTKNHAILVQVVRAHLDADALEAFATEALHTMYAVFFVMACYVGAVVWVAS